MLHVTFTGEVRPTGPWKISETFTGKHLYWPNISIQLQNMSFVIIIQHTKRLVTSLRLLSIILTDSQNVVIHHVYTFVR